MPSPGRIIETGYLAVVICAALVIAPPAYDAIELPKQTLFHIVVYATLVAAAVAWWLRGQRLTAGASWVRLPGPTRFVTVAVLAVVAAWMLSTALSVAPVVSLFGSYQRWSGLHTQLSYVVVFVMAAVVVRDGRRLRRLLLCTAATATLVSLYACAQRMGLDPITWNAGPQSGFAPVLSDQRAFATLGNPDFLGGYLTLTILATAGLVAGQSRRRPGRIAVWASALLVQVVAEVFTESRGAWLGTTVGAGVLLLLTLRTRRQVLAIAAAAVVLAIGVGLARDRLLQERGDTIAVRLALWPAVAQLVLDRPIIGFGPDTLGTVITRHYPPELVRLEQTPEYPVDRAHNAILDTLAAAGLIGALAMAALGLAVAKSGMHSVRLQMDARADRLLVSGTLAALAGHVVEQQFSLEVVASSILAWLFAGAIIGCAPRTGLPATSSRRFARKPPPRVAWQRVGPGIALAAAAIVPITWWSLQPLLADVQYAQGLQALRNGRSGDALRFIALAAATWNVEPFYLSELSTVQLEAARASSNAAPDTLYRQALESAARALRLNPTHPLLLSNWGLVAGEIAAQLEDPRLAAEARTAHRRATTTAPQFWVYWRASGTTEFNLGDYAAAQSALARSTQLWDRDASTWITLGDAAVAGGDGEAGRAAYERALTLRPDDAHARRALQLLRNG